MVEYNRQTVMGTYQNYDSSGLNGDYRGVSIDASGHIITVDTCVSVLRIGSYVQLNSTSGGSPLAISGQWNSGATVNLMIKSMSGNQDVFIGGSGQLYSGHGYALTANEKIEINVCNPLLVYGFASSSGQLVTYMGLDR